jgi:hypothetical protein
MKWPWVRSPENRGTLTLLPNGIVVLGMPHHSDQETAYNVARGVEEWRASGKPMVVFPFPVDVVDKRR